MTDAAWLELSGITKRFGKAVAVDGVNLSVRRGEFLTLLGASGCGKSTTLRMIAGLEQADEGEIRLDGRAVTHVPAHRRQTAMVFQSYALFPHLTVAQNVAFGLEMQGLPPAAVRPKVAEALSLVELDDFAARYPRQLSGGQQQRVALARAVVTEPKALLLDEPLSNLDAKLRDRLRVDLRALQRKLGVTTIYVTHDQSEAMSLSDRVAFMAAGKIVEIATPTQIYQQPRDRATADFLGIANLIDGVVTSVGHETEVDTPLGKVRTQTLADPVIGQKVLACLRPEDMSLGHGAGLAGVISHAAFMGAFTDYMVAIGEGLTLRIHAPGAPRHQLGETVQVILPAMASVIAKGAA